MLEWLLKRLEIEKGVEFEILDIAEWASQQRLLTIAYR